MSLQKGLVLHLSLDEKHYNPATKRVTDQSAYCNHGTSANDAVFGADRMGQANRAMVFGGTSDSINCGNDSSLDLTSAATFCGYAKLLHEPIGYERILSKNYNGAYAIFVRNDGSIVLGAEFGGVVTYNVWSSHPILSDSWTFFTIDYDGSDINYYKNNEHVSTNSPATAGDIGTNASNMCIASSYNFLYRSHVAMSDLRIYNRVLTTTERTRLSESYRPGWVIK